ncbi:MAG: dephospho-CoA kinase [Myxococcaceae bacterium]
MRVYGLTGGIAAGKSTVARALRHKGAHLIDADALAREVVAPGTEGFREIRERFPEALRADGKLDRAALAARVFSYPDDRRDLEAIVQPKIQKRFRELTRAAEAADVPFVIYDAALLVEKGLHHALSGVIVVEVPLEVQVQRLMARDGLSREDALARIQSQTHPDVRRRAARWVIDNAGSLESTQRQTHAVLAEIQRESASGV